MQNKKNKLTKLSLSILLAATATIGMNAYAANTTTELAPKHLTASNSNFLKVSYVDLSAVGALALVSPMSSYAASDIIVFAFAQPSTSSINNSYLSNMKAIEAAAPNSKFFLSGGGAISQKMTDGTAGANNIINQVQGYRQLGIRIDGVDMDFEQGETSQVLWDFANKIKSGSNLLLSAAPQIYFNSPAGCDTMTSSNLMQCLALSSGGQNNNYSHLLDNSFQFLDYLFPQAYNSPNFTINGYNETNIPFYSQAASALSTYVRTLASNGGYNVTTKIAIGEPVNRAAGSPAGTIYGSSATYNQAAILSQLQTQIQSSLQYPLIAGNMMWSVNADYDPADFNDVSAKQGAYSTTIFGATPPVSRNLKVQFTNNASSTSAVITLVVAGTQYYAFYANPSGQNPIPAGQFALWCSMDISSSTCLNSLNLNQIPVGASYRVQVSPNGNAQKAWLCPGTYTLTPGYHNIQVNPEVTGVCAVS